MHMTRAGVGAPMRGVGREKDDEPMLQDSLQDDLQDFQILSLSGSVMKLPF